MNRRNTAAVAFAALVVFASPWARADDTRRLSNAPSGAAGNSLSYFPSISRDGSVVAFTSRASDLVPGDTNGVDDVFVVVRATGAIERVSVASDGTQADGTCDLTSPHLSSDGRYVVFDCAATNLDANDDGTGIPDVFLRDRVAGTTVRISSNSQGAACNGSCTNASISADGRFVVYQSLASDLVAGDVNGAYDTFRCDTTTGTTILVSTDSAGMQGDGFSGRPFISDDGSIVAFSSSSTNFPNARLPHPWSANCYRKSLVTGTLERVDVDWAGAYPFVSSLVCGISSDGSAVLFEGDVAYLADDTNGGMDGYLRDFTNGTVERVTVRTGGLQIDGDPFLGGAFLGSMSSDARFVTFGTWMEVVPQDPAGTSDQFLRDRATGVTSIVSIGTLDEPAGANYGNAANVSDDGTGVVFDSTSALLAPNDRNGSQDAFLRQRSMTPATQLHYGTGFPGRNGNVPTLGLREPPWRGSTVDVDVTNSSSFYVVAFVLIGLARANVPTRLGGDLLVDPLLFVAVPLIPAGGTFSARVPSDYWADGLVVDLQALELDPWAQHGVSFTDGLELTLGDS